MSNSRAATARPLLLLLGLAAMAAAALSARAEPAVERQARLRHLVLQDCGSCHGLSMKGGLGLPLSPEALAGKDDDMLIDAILHGRPGTPMPPWDREITRDEARWLVAQLRQGMRDAR